MILKRSRLMLNVILGMIVLWTILSVLWAIFLASLSFPVVGAHAEGTVPAYDMLQFNVNMTDTKASDRSWDYVRALIGSLHQIRELPEKVPALRICAKWSLSAEQQEELSSWSRVAYSCEFGDGVAVKPWHVYEPAGIEIRRAELITDPEMLKKAYATGRRRMMTESDAARLMVPYEEASSELKCHIDIRRDAIRDGAKAADAIDLLELDRMGTAALPIVVVGAPTTAKLMKKGEAPVLLRALLPSLAKTITPEELTRFKVVVLVGFDNGDAFFDQPKNRERFREAARKILPSEISMILLRLPRLHRVAATWNMLFQRAYERNATWFYQVNDDLTLETAGWLGRFTTALGALGGRGVAGPSDAFNGFRCALLTQGFVHRRHFETFEFLYPLEYSDWKSDRWLSFVYGEEGTLCWAEVRARNGAAGTRYTACPCWSWRVALQRGQQQLAEGVAVEGATA